MMSSRSARQIGALALIGLTLGACAPRVPEFPVPVTPVAAPVPPEVRLVAAIENNGCELTTENTGQILLAANMTLTEMGEIMDRLNQAGRVEVSGPNAVRVLTERCI